MTCVHHWVLEAGRAVELPEDEQKKYPNCIGRKAFCKVCGDLTVKREKVIPNDDDA